MPWDAASFQKHNHALHGAQAGHAARIANAVLQRSGDEGMAIATANKWAQHHAAGGGIMAHRDAGGGMDPSQGIGGLAPSAQTANPMVQGMIQRYASMPTEKLAELSAMMGGSQQGQLIQKLLMQRRLMPQPAQPQQAPPAPTQQGAPYRRGGGTPKRDMGGGMMSQSQASPWWTRSEARSADSGFLHGATPGRADRIETTAPGGAYVIPADVIAGLGEGNSLAGARVMQSVLESGPHGTPLPRGGHGGMGPPRPPAIPRDELQTGGHIPIFPERKAGGVSGEGRATPVALSHGEFVVSPEHVTRIGGGDLKTGHRVLDKWVVAKRAEQIKKLKNLPGPVKT